MAPKRSFEEDASIESRTAKKQRGGFKVGPDNLPDGVWRRKVIKIKKDLITKAKVKKSYAKLKSREPPVDRPIPEANDNESEESWEPEADEETGNGPSQELHPERQAMLDRPRSPTPPPASSKSHHLPNPNEDHASFPRPEERNHERRNRKPKYFEREVAIADKAKAEAAARREEWERREAEKKKKIEERERYRRAMAKARTPGRNGKRKLGRESTVLLERVKKLVSEGK